MCSCPPSDDATLLCLLPCEQCEKTQLVLCSVCFAGRVTSFAAPVWTCSAHSPMVALTWKQDDCWEVAGVCVCRAVPCHAHSL